jgi:hypothetical protein
VPAPPVVAAAALEAKIAEAATTTKMADFPTTAGRTIPVPLNR